MQALGFDIPKFGHMSLILAPDKSKLSKRHGATSVGDFKEQGYLKDAMVRARPPNPWAPAPTPIRPLSLHFQFGHQLVSI